MKWERITDFRDDAIVAPIPRWELVVDEREGETDIEETELPPCPVEAVGHIWQSGLRWLCE